jgi:crossover junction endodeoxyribonuclease RuvC
VIIAGIDPGLSATGFAVITQENEVRTSGVIRPKGKALEHRLMDLYDSLSGILRDSDPDLISLEKVVYHKNPKTALHLGAARGVCLLASAQLGIEVVEYSPTKVKLALTGTGSASKSQVAFMVKKYLGLDGEFPPDETDAMACALVALFARTRETCSAS